MAESAAHVGHDRMSVAEAVDRGAGRASVLDVCRPCAALFADLVALAAALPLAALPARPRDFVLSSDDARRLRPRGWRAWWSILGSGRDMVTQPLAIGFTTLGLAGLLLTAAPSILPLQASGPGAESGLGDRLLTSKVPDPSGATSEVPVRQGVAESLSPLVPWLSVLAVGGSLFVARRVASHRRPVR